MTRQKIVFLLVLMAVGLLAAMVLRHLFSNGLVFQEGVENQDSSGNSSSNSSSESTTAASSSTGVTATASGQNFDGYNHFSQTLASILPAGSLFFGPDGGKAFVQPGRDGTQMLKLLFNGQMQTYVMNPNGNDPNILYGPNGNRVTVVDQDGQKALELSTALGNFLYTVQGSTNSFDQDATTSTQYYGSTGSPIQTSPSNLSYSDPSITEGNSVYMNSLPRGVPRSQIPAGDEDLYILKSQVVPPVCPACPAIASSNREQCPPCPPCGRCPESNFECKKVPNYSMTANEYLPVPVVSDFSSFGM